MAKICLLIPTYKRNKTLFRLLKQCNDIIRHYSGPHRYEICVTDSVRGNEDAERIKSMCSLYVVNEGIGFDDNLFFFYKNHLAGYDYVLSISDDDLLSCASVNPLSFIDIPVSTKAGAVLFNHINFVNTPEGGVSLGRLNYQEIQLTLGDTYFKNAVLTILPRHAGLLYSTEIIARHLPAIADFRNTLHLYAAPLILESRNNNIGYIDYPIVCFCDDPPVRGAWENPSKVFDGLLLFLKNLKRHLPDDRYQVAHNGFMAHYLGTNAGLRRDLQKKGCALASEEEVLQILAA